MFRKAGLIFILSVCLSGCSTLMPYKTEFQCKSPDKGKCATVKAAYDESKKDTVDVDAGGKSKKEKNEEKRDEKKGGGKGNGGGNTGARKKNPAAGGEG